MGIRRIPFGEADSYLIEVVINMFDNVEGVGTNDGLFKIDGSHVFIGFIHIHTDIFDVITLFLRNRSKITVKFTLSS